MIGHPKRLEDLARIEAGVRVTCTTCKRERLINRDRLVAELTRRGLSTAWELLPSRLRCACGSKRVEILAMPFTSGEEDGEALFEALVRAFEATAAANSLATDGPGCRARSDAALVLYQAKVAMRAWIVARAG